MLLSANRHKDCCVQVGVKIQIGWRKSSVSKRKIRIFFLFCLLVENRNMISKYIGVLQFVTILIFNSLRKVKVCNYTYQNVPIKVKEQLTVYMQTY